MRSCLFLFVAVVFVSCSVSPEYKESEIFGFDDFVETKKLDGHVLEFDSLIMHPSDIMVVDSLLLLVDSYDDKQIHLYNLNTQKKIGSRIFSGQGPKDIIEPAFVENDKNELQLFDMVTSRLFRYDVHTFVQEETPDFLQRIKFSKRPLENVEMVDGKVYSHSYASEKRILVFDSKSGEQLSAIVDYPICDINYTDAEKRDAYYMNFASNGKDRIAVCYAMTDLIEIYDLDGNLQKRIHGPEQFFCHLKEVHKGKVITSQMDGDRNRDAYFSPVSAGNYLYLLYDGEKVNAPGHDSLCDYIFSFTWDGKPEILYKLDDSVFTFTIDEDRRKIYAIGTKPEYHIVEYTY